MIVNHYLNNINYVLLSNLYFNLMLHNSAIINNFLNLILTLIRNLPFFSFSIMYLDFFWII